MDNLIKKVKLGRPFFKNQEDVRTIKIKVTLNPKEYAIIKQHSQEEKTSMANLFRKAYYE